MLHITTPLFRYENLSRVYESIPKSDDIVWHIAKTSRREKINDNLILADSRIKIYEIDCADNDLIVKRNTIFSNINEGHFHLLDDDTIFHPSMYETYIKYKDFIGMVIGSQVAKRGTTRLRQAYPALGYIDAGNVLCHSSILSSVKWVDAKESKYRNCRDFVFWNNCFKIFGQENTKLIPDVISVYNALK